MGKLYVSSFMQASPTIPGYHLLERLDGGGLAEVWRAQGPDHKLCALKLVSAADSVASARFLRERELLQGIGHPRVVQAQAFGSTTDWHWLAMDLAPGGSLRERLAQGVPPEDLALRWMADGLEGLSAMHAAGLRHRDVTPANLLLTEDDPPRVLVADLGLARRLGIDDRLTATSTVVGTPAYLAPERANDQADTSDDGVRADVYAMGAVFFHLLTGRAPFTGATPYEVLAKAAGAPRPDPAALRPGVSAQARAMVRCAMAMDPLRRYADAATFAADIRSVLGGGVPSHAGRIRRQAAEASGITAANISAAAPLPVPIRIPWWAIAGLSAGALLLGICIGHSVGKPNAVEQQDLERARQTASAAGWRTFLAAHPTGPGAAEASNLLALQAPQSELIESPRKQVDPDEIHRLTGLIAAARAQVNEVLAASRAGSPIPVGKVGENSSTIAVPAGASLPAPLVNVPSADATSSPSPTEPARPAVAESATQTARVPVASPQSVASVDVRLRDLSVVLRETQRGADVNPADPNDLLVWSSSGPIRRSLDGGRTWTVTMPRAGADGIIAGAWAQRSRANPKTVVISAIMTSVDSPGIAWNSLDGGDTWTTIASPWPASKSKNMDPEGLASRSVVLTDSGVMVAVRSQIDGAKSPAPAQIWRSSNTGRTWAREAKTVANFHTILPVDDGALILFNEGESFDGINVSRDLGRTNVFIGAKVAVTDVSTSVMFSQSPATWARITGGAVILDDDSAETFVILGLDGKVRRRFASERLLRDSNGQIKIESIVINPLDEREWYAAARGLGLLRSSDAGVTWKGFTFNKNVSVVACAGGKSRATLIATGNDTVVIDLGGISGGQELFPLTLAETAARPAGQSR